jgi:hypothetical protein
MEPNDPTIERHVADACRRLNDAAVVPPADPAREAALMAAFDAVHRGESKRRDYWHLAAFAAAAAALIAIGVTPALTGRHGLPSGAASAAQTSQRADRDARLEPPSEFVMVPGASGLPPMESGTLVRIDVPVAMLASYGVTPPPGRGATVTADLIVAQDGLPRAVRLVAP